MYHLLFLLLRPFGFWVRFDTLKSIDNIPVEKKNLTDFCPICMKNLGTRSTRFHKLHDIQYHPRSDKDNVDELVNGCLIVWFLAGFIIVSVSVVSGVFSDALAETRSFTSDILDEITGYERPQPIEYSNSTNLFVESCNTMEDHYNERIRNETLTLELFNQIKEGVGICFERFHIFSPSNHELAEWHINMTNSTLNQLNN